MKKRTAIAKIVFTLTMLVCLCILGGCGSNTEQKDPNDMVKATPSISPTPRVDASPTVSPSYDASQANPTDSTHSITDDMGNLIDDAGDGAGDLIKDAGDIVDDIGQDAGDAIKDVGDDAKDAMDKAKSKKSTK